MLHQIKYAINSLRKNKVYTILNVVGLTLGISTAIVIVIVIFSFTRIDSFHKNEKSIFKLIATDDTTTGEYYDAVSALLAPLVKEELPEVKDYCRYLWANEKIIGSPENHVKENGFYVDESWFTMFTYPLIHGNTEHVLAQPNNIAISRKISTKLFGAINPIGKTIKLYSYESTKPEAFNITGVFEDVGQNSSFQFEFVIPFKYLLNRNTGLRNWNSIGTRAFIQLDRTANIESFSDKITSLVKEKHQEIDDRKGYSLAPLAKSNHLIYKLNGEPSFGFFIIIAIGIIGLSILFTSIINYVNLSIAISTSRRKEIAVRKVNGASKKNIANQFFIETSLIVVFSAIIGYFLQGFIMQFFIEDPRLVKFDFDAEVIFALIGIVGITILFSAWRPSFYLTKLSPARMQSIESQKTHRLSFKKHARVVFQFVSAIVLITTSLILWQQVDHIFSKSMGMDRHHIVYFTKNAQLNDHRDAFDQELSKMPGIKSVTFSNQIPFEIGNATTSIHWKGKEPDSREWFSYINVGSTFAQTMKIKLLNGRDFSFERDENKRMVIVNEAAAKRMNMQDPVGNLISINGRDTEIIGLAQNFNFQMLSDPDKPLFICYDPNGTNMAMIRLKENDEIAGLNSLKKVFASFSPDFILEYSFLDEHFNSRHKYLITMKHVALVAGYLAIIIACIGLLGLTVHNSERRTKELGIRKINGATVKNVISLLSEQIIIKIAIASIIAFPIVYYLNEMILSNFAEKIEINPVHFILSILILIKVTFIIIGWQIWRTAKRNPVDALRYE